MLKITLGRVSEVSTRNHNTSITILRVANISRACVLFTLVGLSTVIYYPLQDLSLLWLLLLILDVLGFVVLMLPKPELRPLGYGWAAIMSILFLVYYFPFLGDTRLFSDVIVILLLSCIQLFALMKIGYDNFITVSQGSE